MVAAGVVALAAVELALLLALPLVLWHLVWRPRAVARAFARQGVKGPPYTFLAGSMPEAKRLVVAGRVGVPPLDASCHDIMPLVLPHLYSWVAQYGKTSLFWIGPIPAILSVDLELIQQVLADRTGLFPKDFMLPVLKVLFGKGVIVINGDDWKRHRKVVLPAFNNDKLKSMTVVTAGATEQMIQRWYNQIRESGTAEIDVNPALCELTEEIIGRVAFGTASPKQAREVVVAMREMQKIGTAATMDAPILWYLPTPRNLRVQRLNKLIKTKIMGIMQARVDAKRSGGRGGYGDDLLGLLLEAWSPEEQKKRGEKLSTQEVIDEWKTFFTAGQETTATLLLWTMFLLSVHPEWQDKVREEVLRECRGGDDGGQQVFNVEDVLGKLKLLHMVLLETSRLYSPIQYIQRRTASDVRLKDLSVPRGTVIAIPVGMLHRDKDVWGPDADEFNPMRFQNGISKAAKDPKALLSFSLGPRACTGQSFGIMEAQVVMGMILTKFSFSLSPEYVHKPKYLISLTPRSGMPLILRSIDG